MQYLIWKVSLMVKHVWLTEVWQYFYITKNSFEKYPFYFIQSKLNGYFFARLYEAKYQISSGLEDPKQATIHLTSTFKLKWGLVYLKRC